MAAALPALELPVLEVRQDDQSRREIFILEAADGITVRRNDASPSNSATSFAITPKVYLTATVTAPTVQNARCDFFSRRNPGGGCDESSILFALDKDNGRTTLNPPRFIECTFCNIEDFLPSQ